MYFLAVPLVGPAVLLISTCCVFPCCTIGRSQTDVYVLCIFFAVPLVGLVLLSMFCVFSLLCHWLVSCCCLCALCFPCCAICWSRSAVYVLCIFLAVPLVGPAVLLISTCCVFPCCTIGRSQTDVYVLCIFFAVPLVGLVLLSMFCVFSLLCHWLVSCCCLCAVYFPCCVIGWSRSAVYVLCIFLAVPFVGLVVLSMCCVFYLLCHLLVS